MYWIDFIYKCMFGYLWKNKITILGIFCIKRVVCMLYSSDCWVWMIVLCSKCLLTKIQLSSVFMLQRWLLVIEYLTFGCWWVFIILNNWRFLQWYIFGQSQPMDNKFLFLNSEFIAEDGNEKFWQFLETVRELTVYKQGGKLNSMLVFNILSCAVFDFES